MPKLKRKEKKKLLASGGGQTTPNAKLKKNRKPTGVAEPPLLATSFFF
jgi:hypothetical protein